RTDRHVVEQALGPEIFDRPGDLVAGNADALPGPEFGNGDQDVFVKLLCSGNGDTADDIILRLAVTDLLGAQIKTYKNSNKKEEIADLFHSIGVIVLKN